MDLKKFLFSTKPPSLSRDQKQILRDQVIDERQPRTILTDFETLLNFIGSAGIKVSGKYNLLPLESVSKLNTQLSRPIEVRLKRQQQKSYPNVHGLYLILRASGMA